MTILDFQWALVAEPPRTAVYTGVYTVEKYMYSSTRET